MVNHEGQAQQDGTNDIGARTRQEYLVSFIFVIHYDDDDDEYADGVTELQPRDTGQLGLREPGTSERMY